MTSTAEQAVAATAHELELELSEDIVGIWEIFKSLREEWDGWDNESITVAAEGVLAHLVAAGAEFGDLDDDTGYFVPWPDQEGAIQRASREWQAMDGDPNIDDIAWLEREDPQHQRRAPAEPENITPDELVDRTTELLMTELERGRLIGPWILFLHLHHARWDLPRETIWDVADEVLRRLVEGGAVVGDYDPLTRVFTPWPDQTTAVRRASQGWRALDRGPAVGEICWIQGPAEHAGSRGTGRGDA